MPTNAAPPGPKPAEPAAPLGEQEVLAGLKKRKLAERVRYILAAPATRSEAVFDALAALYPVNNTLKASVLLAMRKLNERCELAFTAKLTNAVRADLERKAGAQDEFRHFLVLLAEIDYWQQRPRPAADEFVRWAVERVDGLVAALYDSDTAANVRAETADAACVYFALRGDEHAFAGLRERLAKSRTGALRAARERLLVLFTARRDAALCDYGCELLRSVDLRFPEPWVRFAAGFGDYARTVGRELPAEVAQKIGAVADAAAQLAAGTLESRSEEEDDDGAR